ncbi:hypothetical protein VTI74DRAFT_2267 [Chaetomium olivicolor]
MREGTWRRRGGGATRRVGIALGRFAKDIGGWMRRRARGGRVGAAGGGGLLDVIASGSIHLSCYELRGKCCAGGSFSGMGKSSHRA